MRPEACGLRIIVVGAPRIAKLAKCIHAGGLEGHKLVASVAADRKRTSRAVVGRVREVEVVLEPDKGGEDALPAPERIAEAGPLVVVLGDSVEGDGGVYRGRAADDAAAGEGQRAARGAWRVFEVPVV